MFGKKKEMPRTDVEEEKKLEAQQPQQVTLITFEQAILSELDAIKQQQVKVEAKLDEIIALANK